MAGSGKAIGTTSGGADSWNPIFAKDLKRKRVIILPDDDEAGERYSEAVQESLNAVGIAYSVVTFAGTGAKDVSEYMEELTVEDFVRLIGFDKMTMPDGLRLRPTDQDLADPVWREQHKYSTVVITL
jgi:hypothetical protein